MTWFFAILVVAAIGGVAVVAAGRGGSMAETYDDRPDAQVPADGPLTSGDLRRVRFSTAFRGYRMSEVDALVDRLSAELDSVRTHQPRRADAGATAAGATAVGATAVEPGVAKPRTVEPRTDEPSA